MPLLRYVFFLAVAMQFSSATSLYKLIRVLLDNSTCPGIVLTPNTWLPEGENICNQLGRPVTLFGHNHPETDREILCSDAVIFIERMTEFLPIYRQLQGFYYLNKVIAVTESIDQVDNVLQEAENEGVSVLFHQMVIKWTVSGQIFRFPYFDFKKYYDFNLKFSGRHLRVATLHYPPAVVVRHDQSLDGIEPSLMNLIAGQLNFTFDYVLASADEMWGDIVTDSGGLSFTGIRGMLVRKEVDVAHGELYMHPSWLPFHGFSQVYKTDFDCFIVPAPRPMANWMALITPFSSQTWIATLTAFVLVSSILALSDRASFLFVLGQLLWVQQPRLGGNESLGRLLLIIFWLFAATILPTVYRSGLISFLTRPYFTPPIDTFQQLVESPIKKVMFTDFYKSVLLNSTDPYRRQLGQQLVTSHNMSHMLSLLDTGNWAMDSSLDNLRYVAGENNKRLHLMKERLFSTRSSFGLQKDSPLKPAMDRVIQRLIEAGLVEYHRSANYGNNKKNDEIPESASNDDRLVRFSLDNLQGAFYLLSIGVVIATLAFVTELIVAKCINRVAS